MAQQTSTRLLIRLLTPGGVLIAAAWALQSELVVREAAAPYAVFFAVGALAAAILLCWYHDQARLLSAALATALTVAALSRWPDDSHAAKLPAIALLPLNFALFGALRESGVMSVPGLVSLGVVLAQAAGVASMAGGNRYGPIATWVSMPLSVHLSFLIAALTIAALLVRRRTNVEAGLLMALVSMFLGLRGMPSDQALLFYAGSAGLILMLTALEQGYEIAHRDELTGLPGRRAFNSMMGQLGRTYAIAMCDVDHFKKFNDTYGHDVGDQVLRMVAAKLLQVGGGGRVFRYGGEEFLVVFRGRSAMEAAPFAESVRKAIADAGFVLRGQDRPVRRPSKIPDANQTTHPRVTSRITVSIGLADRSQRHSTPELVLDAADAALYRAKEAGRNCVKLADFTQRSSD